MITAIRPSIPPFFRSPWGKISILVALALAIAGEQAVFALSDSSPSHHAGPPPTTVRGKIVLAVHDALGSSDRGVRRFQIVSIRKSTSGPPGYTVTIRWAINNDISAGTVGNGAQADAYLVFSNLFALHVPFRRVNLVGTYPVSSHGETVVERLAVDSKSARVISSYGWQTLDPETVWPLIRRIYVSPDFQPVPTG